ncbi:endoglucanase [Stackebrandtia endophytica]|uniref:Glucanase n=1 Tax=Stackebrandtia endophytica TaxID=1496996 RepID=A0A543AY12_9ACTN|nr:glycoside hydrolase family 6 protein [Stackebrandtia endophytica]TQL77410.1 endoglucanase [Stackebrandtia endophytica]
MKPSRTLVAIAGVAAVAVAASVATTAIAEPTTTDTDSAATDFYVNPDSNAYRWLADNPGHSDADLIRSELAEVPTANWYGDWDNIPVGTYADNAAAEGKMPVVVAYNIYERDCWGHSGGGADTPDEYRQWIDAFSDSLGDAEAIVILEPDALSHVDEPCMTDRQTRLDLLEYAVGSLARNQNAQVYLDAGNAEWAGSPEQVAGYLDELGTQRIRGFSLNVSNYYTTELTLDRAAAINAALPQPLGFVVDTSRNGSGRTDDSEDGWCNPVGATLGDHPGYSDGPADAHLWIKVPGDSDGNCNYGEGTTAGHFSEKLAVALITGDYR